jgi:regulatory protein
MSEYDWGQSNKYFGEHDQSEESGSKRPNRRYKTYKPKYGQEAKPAKSSREYSPEEQEERARQYLLNLLARSSKSTSDLRKALDRREIPAEVYEPILQRFTEVGLIDDAKYAEAFSRTKQANKGLSKSAIRRELGQHGIEATHIEDALENISGETELATAIELAIKRFRAVQNLDKQVRYRRISGFLARKGYSQSIISAAIREAEAQAVKSEA